MKTKKNKICKFYMLVSTKHTILFYLLHVNCSTDVIVFVLTHIRPSVIDKLNVLRLLNLITKTYPCNIYTFFSYVKIFDIFLIFAQTYIVGTR